MSGIYYNPVAGAYCHGDGRPVGKPTGKDLEEKLKAHNEELRRLDDMKPLKFGYPTETDETRGFEIH